MQTAAATGPLRTAEDRLPWPPSLRPWPSWKAVWWTRCTRACATVVPAWTARLSAVAARVREFGMKRPADDLGSPATRLDAARASCQAVDEAALAAAWTDAALRVTVGLEQLGT
ncbi:hypothetical protein ACN28S_30870 [Cystobacter fuscus]